MWVIDISGNAVHLMNGNRMNIYGEEPLCNVRLDVYGNLLMHTPIYQGNLAECKQYIAELVTTIMNIRA